MTIVSELKNTKSDKAAKTANLKKAHHRIVRRMGESFRITVATVGPMVLASATCITDKTQPEVNLFDTAQIARDLKKLCENGLYT